MNFNQEAESLEKQFKSYEAGARYLQDAFECIKKNENNAKNVTDYDKSPELFMKAARCFEKIDMWRMADRSWGFCEKALKYRLKTIEKDKFNYKTLREKLNPYFLTDEKWNNPEPGDYKKNVGREANIEEKDKHRRAWVLDYAGQLASRHNKHEDAAARYFNAGEAWLSCESFPGYQLIASKFFMFSACERILSVSNQGIHNVEKKVFKILELIETNANNKSFRAYVMKIKENAYFRTIAMYFRTIGNYAFSAGLKEIKDKCIKYENKYLRKFFLSNLKYYHKLIGNFILFITTGNGTSNLRFFASVLIISIVIFPLLFYFVGFDNIVNDCIERKTQLSDVVYFSFVTLTTLGYGDFQPVGFARLIAMIEAICGYIFLGIFVWLFTRKMN